MHTRRQAPAKIRTGKSTGIWLALAVALGLHALIMFVPVTRQTAPAEHIGTQIELRLTTAASPPSVTDPVVSVPVPEPEPEPQKPEPTPIKKIVETQPSIKPPTLTPISPLRELDHNLERMSEKQRTRLTNSILSSQFITEESATDQLFGKQIRQYASEPRREFHYPDRENMIAMLDQPMSELPFAYTPGLIHFAYDPGFKGELQRFWDVITPEFGWITDNGTEFKCVWILVIGACGWK